MKRTALISYRGERSQVEMAKKYGVSQALWSNWENGTKTPRVRMMFRLAEDSSIPVKELFYDIFNKAR